MSVFAWIDTRKMTAPLVYPTYGMYHTYVCCLFFVLFLFLFLVCIHVGCCEDRRKGAPHLGGSTFLHERERMYLFVYVGAQWMYVGVMRLFLCSHRCFFYCLMPFCICEYVTRGQEYGHTFLP